MQMVEYENKMASERKKQDAEFKANEDEARREYIEYMKRQAASQPPPMESREEFERQQREAEYRANEEEARREYMARL